LIRATVLTKEVNMRLLKRFLSISSILVLAAAMVAMVLVASTVNASLYPPYTQKMIKDGINSPTVNLLCSNKTGFVCNHNCSEAPKSYCCTLCYDPATGNQACTNCGVWTWS